MNTSKKIINSVVTGFDPFGGISLNPSEEIVNALPDKIKLSDGRQIKLTKLILPTSGPESWEILSSYLAQNESKAINLTMLGLAEERQLVSLEKVALNLRDYRIEDNKGNKFPFGKIDESIENAIFNEIDLEKVNNNLKNNGHLTDISYHAGTFVCNELYFQSLKYKLDKSHLFSSLFVHIPALVDKDEIDNRLIFKSKDEQLADLRDTIISILKEQAYLSYTNGSAPS